MASHCPQRMTGVINRYFFEMHENYPELHPKVIFRDEADLHNSGFGNKQNCRSWGSKKPSVIVEKPLHSHHGPYFFKNEAGVRVTVNG